MSSARGDKVCINEEHLQLLTGQRSLRLKSDCMMLEQMFSRPRFRRHNYYAHPLNDDNDDYPPPHCPGKSHDYQHNVSHSIENKGNFKGWIRGKSYNGCI